MPYFHIMKDNSAFSYGTSFFSRQTGSEVKTYFPSMHEALMSLKQLNSSYNINLLCSPLHPVIVLIYYALFVDAHLHANMSSRAGLTGSLRARNGFVSETTTTALSGPDFSPRPLWKRLQNPSISAVSDLPRSEGVPSMILLRRHLCDERKTL